MGTITVEALVNRAADILADPDNVRWTRTELLSHFNDAQRACVLHRPEVNPMVADFDCVAGTMQALPDGAFELISVIRNKDSSKTRPIVHERRENLDRYNKTWHDAPSPFVQVYVYTYEPQFRNRFFLYPAPPANHTIEIVYSKIPATVTDEAVVIEIDDVYEPGLLNFMLFRAYSKDSGVEGNNIQTSQAYYQRFLDMFPAREMADQRLNPADQVNLARERSR